MAPESDVPVPDSTSNEVNFMNHSMGNVSNYFWSFGNGQMGNTENPSITYSRAGIYEVDISDFNSRIWQAF